MKTQMMRVTIKGQNTQVMEREKFMDMVNSGVLDGIDWCAMTLYYKNR